MTRLASVQSLRFVAASAVVLTHCASGKFLFGAFGVDIFFVISGFIITKVMARREAVPFIKDRLSRIYPIYWVCLIPLIIAGWDGTSLRLLTSVTLWPVFGEFRRSFLAVGWTLHFEMLFYAAAALVLRRRAMLPILMISYGAALAVGLTTTQPLLGFLGSPMILEFLMGVVIASMPFTQLRRPGAIMVVAGLVAAAWGTNSDFGAIENMFNGEAAWRWAKWGMPAALIVWGSMQFEGLLSGRIFQFSAAGGDASYALYLSHPVFLLYAPSNPYVLLALGPPALIARAFFVHYKIEKPLLRLVRKLLAGKHESNEQRPISGEIADP